MTSAWPWHWLVPFLLSLRYLDEGELQLCTHQSLVSSLSWGTCVPGSNLSFLFRGYCSGPEWGLQPSLLGLSALFWSYSDSAMQEHGQGSSRIPALPSATSHMWSPPKILLGTDLHTLKSCCMPLVGVPFLYIFLFFYCFWFWGFDWCYGIFSES